MQKEIFKTIALRVPEAKYKQIKKAAEKDGFRTITAWITSVLNPRIEKLTKEENDRNKIIIRRRENEKDKRKNF